MFNKYAARAAQNREDLSPYLVHFTRDNTNHFTKTGKSAHSTFNDIWNQKVIRARRVLCMHRDLIRQESPEIQAKFKVACFTESPLTQIKHFVGVYRRDYRFEGYGFIFKKETLLMKGVSPAQYINQYGTYSLRAWADRLYEMAKKTNFAGLLWQGIPFMNSVHSGNDFDWEREWKVRGNVAFRYRELAGVILPERTASKMWHRALDNGVPVISAEWNRDRIEETLAKRPKPKAKRTLVRIG
jgi:hypothetical protein